MTDDALDLLAGQNPIPGILSSVATTDPDQHAKATGLAHLNGIPRDQVEVVLNRNNRVQQRLLEQGHKRIADVGASKTLTQWMRDPENARIAQDDLESLLGVHAHLGRLKRRESWLGDVYEGARAGFVGLGSSMGHVAIAAGADPSEWVELIASANRDVDRATAERSRDLVEYYEDLDKAPWWWVIPRAVAEPGNLLTMVAENLGFMSPAIGLGLAGAAVNPLLGAAGGFAGGTAAEFGAWVNQAIREAGYDISDPNDLLRAYSDELLMRRIQGEGLRKGVGTGLADALLTGFAGRLIGKLPKGASFARTARVTAAEMGFQMLGEGAGEYVGQAFATGQGDLREAMLEAVAALGQGAVRTGAGAAWRRGARPPLEKLAKAVRAEQDAKTALGAAEATAASKAAQRDIGRWGSLIKALAPDQIVHVQRADWDALHEGGGQDAFLKAGGTEQDWAESGRTGFVSIGYDRYIQLLSAMTLEERTALARVTRFSDDGPTLAEVDEELQDVAERAAAAVEGQQAANPQVEQLRARLAELDAQIEQEGLGGAESAVEGSATEESAQPSEAARAVAQALQGVDPQVLRDLADQIDARRYGEGDQGPLVLGQDEAADEGAGAGEVPDLPTILAGLAERGLPVDANVLRGVADQIESAQADASRETKAQGPAAAGATHPLVAEREAVAAQLAELEAEGLDEAAQAQVVFEAALQVFDAMPVDPELAAVVYTTSLRVMAKESGLPLAEVQRLFPIEVSDEAPPEDTSEGWRSLGQGPQALLPDVVEIDGVERPTRNSWGWYIARNMDALRSFWRSYGDSVVVNELGQPLLLLHGTTHEFTEIGGERGNPENNQGTGFYMSTSPEDVNANYATERGPDLLARMRQWIESNDELLTEEFQEAVENGEIPYVEDDIDDAVYYEWVDQKAREVFVGDGPRILPVYAFLQNPIIIGGRSETTFDLTWDEGEFWSGSLTELLEDIAFVADSYGVSIDFGELLDLFAMEGEREWTVTDIRRELDHSGMFSDAFDYESDALEGGGVFVGAQILREAYERAGFDGVLDNAASERFRHMRGVNPNTKHVVAFDGRKVKSAIANEGTFDLQKASILEQSSFDQPADYEFDEGAYRPTVVAWAREEFGNRIAPNGKPVWQNFVRWFGDSKVVDDQGRPLRVYHGTTRSGIRVFHPQSHFGTPEAARQRLAYGTAAMDGNLLGKDWRRDDAPVESGAVIYPVYLRAESLLEVDDASASDPAHLSRLLREEYGDRYRSWEDENITSMPVDFLREVGVDGYSYINDVEDPGSLSYVVFDPTQVKSAIGNVGDFEASSPSILEQRGSLARKVQEEVADESGAPTASPEWNKHWSKWQPGKHKERLEGRSAYKGMPEWVQGPSDLRKLRRQLSKMLEEGREARFWYEDSAGAVLRYVGGDIVQAEKLIALLAIYSPHNDVVPNTVAAIKAYEHWRSGKPESELSAGFGSADRKARAVLYRDEYWDGRKTSSFYRNLMHLVWQQATPEERARLNMAPDLLEGMQVVTIDLWMLRAFGYRRADASNSIAGKYAQAERETYRLTALLNQGLEQGEQPWLPHQVQAAIWAGARSRWGIQRVKSLTEEQSLAAGDMVWETKLVENSKGKKVPKKVRAFPSVQRQLDHLMRWRENALSATQAEVRAALDAGGGIHFGTVMGDQSFTVTAEAMPTTALGLEVNGESFEVRQAFSDELLRIIEPNEDGTGGLRELLGIQLGVPYLGVGGYESAFNPSFAHQLLPARITGQADAPGAQHREVVDRYARAMQYLLRQDAVPWFSARMPKATASGPWGSPDKPNNFWVQSNGRKVPGTARMTQREAQQALDEHRAALLADADGMRNRDGTYTKSGQKKADMAEGLSLAGSPTSAGFRLRFARPFSGDFETAFFGALREALGDDAGYTRVSPTEVVVINFRGEAGVPFLTDDDSFIEAIRDLPDAEAFSDNPILDTTFFQVEGDYGPVHDWAADPDGVGLRARSAAGGSALDQWLLDRREEIERVTAERWTGDALAERRAEVEASQRLSAPASDGAAESLNTLGSEREGRRKGALVFEAFRGDPRLARLMSMRMLEGADASTFVHETAHVWGEMVQQLARHPDAEPGIKHLWNLLREEFGIAEDGVLEEHHHEHLARVGEVYVIEGKAPNSRLETVLAALAEFMVRIYESIAGIQRDYNDWLVRNGRDPVELKLTDNLREFFDTLWAAHAELEAAAYEVGEAQLPDEVWAGASKAQRAEYKVMLEEAKRAAQAGSVRRMKAASEKLKRAVREQRVERMRAEIRDAVNRMPETQALYRMRDGTKPDGSPLGENEPWFAIFAPSVEDEELLKRLMALGVTVEDPIEAALPLGQVMAAFGRYDSAEDFVDALERAARRDEEADKLVEAQMKAMFADELPAATQRAIARRSMASEERLRATMAELRQLRRQEARARNEGATALQRAQERAEEARRRAAGERAAEGLRQGARLEEEQGRRLQANVEAGAAERRARRAEDALERERRNRNADRGEAARQRERADAAERAAAGEAAALGLERQRQRDEVARRREALTPDATIQVLRERARTYVAQIPVGSLQPDRFLSAAGREARKSASKARAGKWGEAAQAKERELYNLELFRAARKAKAEATRHVKGAQRRASPTTVKRLNQTGSYVYNDMIANLLERFGIQEAKPAQRERRVPLPEFIERNRENRQRVGDWREIAVSQELLDESWARPWKELTLDQIRDIRETIDSIYTIANTQDKLFRAQAKESVEETATDLEASIRASKPKRKDADLINEGPVTFGDKVLDQLDDLYTWLAKMPVIARIMDSYADGGPMVREFIWRMNDMQVSEADLNEEVSEALERIASKLPGFGKQEMKRRTAVPGLGYLMSREEILSAVLLYGNETGRDRLQNLGLGKSEMKVLVDQLADEEVDFLNAMWSYYDSWWPRIVAKELRTTGVEPQRVEAIPFRTADGRMLTGGYHPQKYQGVMGRKNEVAEIAKQMKRGAATASQTRRGYTKARYKHAKGKVRLDFGVVTQHFREVVHDLTHHEGLVDMNRLLSHKKVEQAIVEHYGMHTYKRFQSLLEHLATGPVPAKNAMEHILDMLRVNTSTSMLAFKVVTGAVNVTGLFQSARRVGYGHIMRGMMTWLGSTKNQDYTAAWVKARSSFMRQRFENLHQTLHDIHAKLTDPPSTWLGKNLGPHAAWRQWGWLIIIKTQEFVDYPTWVGQYTKSIEAGASQEQAVRDADQAVRDTQGSAQLQDLAEPQRSGPVWKLFLTFYFYMSTTFSQTAETVTRFKRTKTPAAAIKMMSDLMTLYWFPAMTMTALRYALRGTEADDDEVPEELWHASVDEMLEMMLGTVPIGREFGAAIKGFDYKGPAGLRVIPESIRFGQQLMELEWDEQLRKSTVSMTGLLFGTPASMINSFLDGYTSVANGDVTGMPRTILAPLVGRPYKEQD